MIVDPKKIEAVLTGRASYFALSRPERREVIYELHRRGLSGQEVEELFAIPRHTFTKQCSRLNLARPVRYYPKQAVPPAARKLPAHEPQCLDEGARFTIIPIDDIALLICEPCQVKAWCLSVVMPRDSHFDGVAGGIGWINGRAVKSIRQVKR